MLALGVLKDTCSAGLFTADTAEPIRPGKDAALLVATDKQASSASQDELITAAILAGAERTRDRAIKIAEGVRSTTTLAALAQAHAVVGEQPQALASARAALELSLIEVTPADDSPRLADAVSAALAAEVMARFGQAEDAYKALKEAPLPQSLRITLATIAVELGRYDDAMSALDGQEGAMVESFRGFLLASKGEHQKAIPHLRNALRQAPDDVDAAMNLSVSLWALGSHRKAVATALRASRTAPGRRDLSLHYLELLLEQGDEHRLNEEIAALKARKVVADAPFLVIQARALIAKGDLARAIPLLNKASAAADDEGNVPLRVEIVANLAALRFRLGRQTYDQTINSLSDMLRQFPSHESVVMIFARIARRTSEAEVLRRAAERIYERTTPVRRAYLRHQVAWLEGDNQSAGSAASQWFDLEPRNPLAAGTAIVALGIGLERWREAEKVADFALANPPVDPIIVNNAAYVLAMVGRAPEAIRLLEPLADKDFVLKATLGLAYLAMGDIDRGMRLYRKAADVAEQENSESRSLMTAYQAVIVRQLGIDKSERSEVIAALALASSPLPRDWEAQPDFVRLRNLCRKRGYDWPLSL